MGTQRRAPAARLDGSPDLVGLATRPGLEVAAQLRRQGEEQRLLGGHDGLGLAEPAVGEVVQDVADQDLRTLAPDVTPTVETPSSQASSISSA